MMNTSRILAAAALGAALIAGPVGAQTAVVPATPDPESAALIDRVDQLEDQLRKATAENERLQFQLQQSQAEVTRLTSALAAMSPPPATIGSGDSGGDQKASAPAEDKAPADPATAFKAAYNLLTQGNHAGAAKAFRSFLKTYPSNEQAPDARFWLGQALMAQGDNAGAADQFLNVVKTSAKSSKAPDAYVHLGIAFKKMGQKDQACVVLKDVPAKFPNASPQVKKRASDEAKSCPA